jgi:hypothetical protein
MSTLETSGGSWVGLHVICITFACAYPTHSQGTMGSLKVTLQSSNNLGLDLPAAPRDLVNPSPGAQHGGNKRRWSFLASPPLSLALGP